MSERPAGVPEGAYWDEDDNEWCLPERDDNDEFHGLVTWWRPDGTVCCKTQYVHGSPHGSFQRFHENGEVSREGEFVEGSLQGTNRYYRSTAETSENFPYGLGDAVKRAEMDYESGRVVAARCYDENDNQCMEDGEPFPESVPDGVPADAHFRKREADDEYRWVKGEVVDNGDGTIDRVGTWQWWSAEGVLVAEEPYQKGKRHGTCRFFDDDGTLKEEVTYASGNRHGMRREFEDGELTEERNYVDGKVRGLCKKLLHEDERGSGPAVYQRGEFEDDDATGLIEFLDAEDKVIGSLDTGRESGYEVMQRVFDTDADLTGLSQSLAKEGFVGPSLVALARAVGRGEAGSADLQDLVHKQRLPESMDDARGYRTWYCSMVVSNMLRFGAGPAKCANTFANAFRVGADAWETLRSIAANLDDYNQEGLAKEVIDGAIAAAPQEVGRRFEFTRGLIRASAGDPDGAKASVAELGQVDANLASRLGVYFGSLFPSWSFWPGADSRRSAAAKVTGLLQRTRAKSEPEVEPFRLAIQKSATRIEHYRERLVTLFGERDWIVPSVSQLLPDGPVDVPIPDRYQGVGIQHLSRQEWTRLTWLCHLCGLTELALPESMQGTDDYVPTNLIGWTRVYLAFGLDDVAERVTAMLEASDVAADENKEELVTQLIAAANDSDWFGMPMSRVEDLLDSDFLHGDELAFLSTLKFYANTEEDLFDEQEDDEDED
jgi:antitoxin component YwqK of YwqJK toxin-antitoxin module